jgi:hypothetical protein
LGYTASRINGALSFVAAGVQRHARAAVLCLDQEFDAVESLEHVLQFVGDELQRNVLFVLP